MTSKTIMLEDICGPTLFTDNSVLFDMVTWILIVYPLIAVGLNCYIFFFLYQNSRKLWALGIRGTDKDTKTKQQMTLGMILQSLLPIFAQLPMLTTALFYWRGRYVPQFVWNIDNVIFHIGLTLNPVITVIFVRQFRQAVLEVFKLNRQQTKFTFTVNSNRWRIPKGEKQTHCSNSSTFRPLLFEVNGSNETAIIGVSGSALVWICACLDSLTSGSAARVSGQKRQVCRGHSLELKLSGAVVIRSNFAHTLP
ncbi:hypothetical protein L596_019597 [Steinernema carpocapsae]|uniref:G-protein coupled receptors family 1 profile domain-containing protein n=1 Tax=Steinernema carpocapsae TaxID=34508 RepID=A0A4U5MRT5_STECR|nr:hypothetical protein L596_019597 [Steinernema carpocapsae]